MSALLRLKQSDLRVQRQLTAAANDWERMGFDSGSLRRLEHQFTCRSGVPARRLQHRIDRRGHKLGVPPGDAALLGAIP